MNNQRTTRNDITKNVLDKTIDVPSFDTELSDRVFNENQLVINNLFIPLVEACQIISTATAYASRI